MGKTHNTLQDYLKNLEQEPEPVEKLASAITKEAQAEDTDMESLVAVIDARINEAFEKFAEAMQKEAVGTVGPTADPQAVAPNPSVQMPRTLSPEAEQTNSQVAQIIAQLTNGERMAGPNGYVAGPAGIIGGATARGTDQPIAGTAERQMAANTPTKTAVDRVVGMVYNNFFGEG